MAEWSSSLKARIFLGNSSKQILTQERFYTSLESGKNIEQIKNEYRGWNKKPLEVWRESYANGSYRNSPAALPQNEAEKVNGEFSKEDAIEFLAAGIPAEEIHAAWPELFSLQQLRAFKAHITMGTYASHEVESNVDSRENYSVPQERDKAVSS